MNTIRLQRPRTHGPAVKRVQELLLDCGHELDVDGVYGPATSIAVIQFQRDNNLLSDGICGPKTLGVLLDGADGPVECDTYQPIIDIRDTHNRPRLYARQRTWDEISGVTLHQTGCGMPRNPLRWGRLNAHIGLTQEGQVIIVNDPTAMIWHAQGLSKSTIGIEIEGNYPGLCGRKNTLWRGGGGPHGLNSDMLTAAGYLFEWLQNAFSEHNENWDFIHAHRQSANSRIADPGQEIWKKIAIPWIQETGATDGGEHFRLGGGRTVPREWDSYRKQRYWS